MASIQDGSIGLILESIYGVNPGPVTRWFEYIDESLNFDPTRVQGKGLRVGGRLARSGRRVTPMAQAKGDLQVEAVSKGMGLLWNLALGSSVSTLVSAGVFQQVHTLGDAPPSATIQKGLPQVGGTVDPYTFVGMMVAGLELDFPNGDLVTAKFTFDGKDVGTGTAYAAPSYATSPNLFHFANGAITSGALTAPTTIALGSGASVLADIRGGSLSLQNNLVDKRFNYGGGGRKSKPVPGLRSLSGKLDIEYDSNVFAQAFLNDTPMNLILTWQGAALAAGFETLQVIIPEIKFDDELPNTNGTDLIVQGMQFTGLDNLTAAQPFWIVTRTADTAL